MPKKPVELVKSFTACSVFVLLSVRETFGIVYREAMAVGRPVISSPNGGIEDGWDDSNGILLNGPSAEEDVADALAGDAAQLLLLYDGRAISARCLQHPIRPT